jgi:hypothetical protein
MRHIAEHPFHGRSSLTGSASRPASFCRTLEIVTTKSAALATAEAGYHFIRPN